MTGYCNISPIKLILSKPLLKVGFRKLKQNVLQQVFKDLNNWQQIWSSRNDQSEREEEPSEDLLTELWTQRKIHRNRGRHLKMSTIPLCQARTYIAVLRRYNTTLDFEAPLLRVFLVDLYSAPVLVGRFKSDGVVKVSRTCWDFQGKRS